MTVFFEAFPLEFKTPAMVWEKFSKKHKKCVDGRGVGAIASRAATNEGGRETICRSWCRRDAAHPIGFLVPSKRIFDSVAQHGTCQKREAVSWKQRTVFKAWDDISPRNAGKRKKIELCAARL